MFSFLKKKKIIPHVRLTGIIGSAGKFKQGMELANQRDILKKAFSVKKKSHMSQYRLTHQEDLLFSHT